MATFKRTRTADSIDPGSCSFDSTNWANLCSSVGEVFTMNQPVAFDTQGFAIGNIKAKIGKLCPRFNVVGVDQSLLTAILAGISIALKHSGSPFSNLWGKPCAITFKGFTIFPARGVLSVAMCLRTRMRAILFSLIQTIKWFIALWTYPDVWGSAVGPTLPAAIFRCIGAKFMLPIYLTASGAGKINPFPSFHYYASLDSHDYNIYQNYRNCKQNTFYCDIMKRWEDYTGEKSKLEER